MNNCNDVQMHRNAADWLIPVRSKSEIDQRLGTAAMPAGIRREPPSRSERWFCQISSGPEAYYRLAEELQ